MSQRLPDRFVAYICSEIAFGINGNFITLPNHHFETHNP